MTGDCFLEKYIHPARHIEIQILGDGKKAMVVGERECSFNVDTRKVLEEAPARFISEETRKGLGRVQFDWLSRLVIPVQAPLSFWWVPMGVTIFLR